MHGSEVRESLGNALHRKIKWAEWEHLKRTNLVSDYSTGEICWKDFRFLAVNELDRIRRFYDDMLREELGEIDAEPDHDAPAATSTDLSSFEAHAAMSSLSDRTVARARAINALDRLHAGDRFTPRPIIHSTRVPRGGVDGTLPQWVIFLGVEAWAPADEVKEAYLMHQQTVLAEKPPPKTQVRTFEVAKFVWEEERMNGGERPPWPVMCERWNSWSVGEQPLTKPFNDWRDFYKYFERGEKATPPRYRASNEQLTKQVESGAHKRALDAWVSSFRE